MDTEDGTLNDLAGFREASRRFASMKEAMKVNYLMLVKAYIHGNTALCLEKVHSLQLPNDLTNFEIISVAIDSLDVFSKKFVNDIVVTFGAVLATGVLVILLITIY